MIDSYYYKEILEASFLDKCKKNPRYSLSAFARSIGLSQGYLSKIFSGQNKLSLEKSIVVAEKLGLEKEDKEKFFISASLDRDSENLTLTNSFSCMIENPLYHLILNTLKLDDFKTDIDSISKKINCDKTIVQSFLDKLLELELVKCENGEWKRCFHKTISHDQVAPESQKSFHKNVLKKAILSLDKYPSEQRNITGITMAIDPNQIELAAKEISRFREKMRKILKDGNKTEVYHLEVGLFPL